MRVPSITLMLGDCLERMREIPDGSVDSIVSDPPYGLRFMGKSWDSGVPGVEVWSEALRVLKPGGHCLAFSGTRTYHRMACAIEDAGFEIRDQVGWLCGNGMPKTRHTLKPAWEPIALARKPLEGTIAGNMAAHLTGALNIDRCRIETDDDTARTQSVSGLFSAHQNPGVVRTGGADGRWPANVIHDGSEEVLAEFAKLPDTSRPGRRMVKTSFVKAGKNVYGGWSEGLHVTPTYDDVGTPARFFYSAKATKADRGDGNNHPTVKPRQLMRYLCKLVTPGDGVVLDPFMGSGSTGIGAISEGFRFIGIERDEAYFAIAEKRIADAREAMSRERVA